MFVEYNGRKEVKGLKEKLYNNYSDTVFKTNKNFNLRPRMYAIPLKDNDTLSDLVLRDNSDITNDLVYADCYVLYLGMTSGPSRKMCTMC